MDELLTPVSQTYLRKRAEEPLLSESKPRKASKPQDASILSLTDALALLKNQPDYDTLISALKFASQGDRISKPSPESAQIIQVLVSDILPNYWPLLRDGDPPDLALFLRCLLSVTGVNALVARLKSLTQESKEMGQATKRPDISIGLDMLLQVSEALLGPDEKLLTLWRTTRRNLDSDMKRKTMGHEVISLFSGGRLVSVAAEAVAIARQGGKNEGDRWIADGLIYSKWLGRNISAWMMGGASPEEEKLCSDLFFRALRLGYSEHLIRQLVEGLLLGSGTGTNAFMRLFGHLTQLEQKRVLFAVIKYLSETFLNKLDPAKSSAPNDTISSAAGVIDRLIADEEIRKNHLIVWLTSSIGAGLGEGVGVRRAVLAALAKDKEAMATVLEKSLNQFGDQLYIKHSPTLQQEAHAQVLLLTAGYVHRASPLKLKMLMRSSTYLQTISNRLEAFQSRSKFLGIVIGEELSSLSDASQMKLDFQMEETGTEDAQWYKSLTRVADQVGPIEFFFVLTPGPKIQKPKEARATPKHPKNKPAVKRPVQPVQSGFVIEEIEDSDESEDDDLVPYAKPHSDPEDSDEDPTLIRRDKPKAPVYVRDLISYFRDTENYDTQKLALATAPTLIRRKANFGTEVSEHAAELASLLVGVQDKFEMDSFHDLRLQGMLALIVAQPKTMAPWFAKTFFDGDYSISQRASILVVLGLGARELAGFDVSEYAATASFPSKRLPERMERLYLDANTPGAAANQPVAPPGSDLKAVPSNALDTIAHDLTSTFLAPLAADAADAATGPDILKLSTFTSRLENNNNTNAQGEPKPGNSNSQSKPRVRSIPNTTAALLATSFFAPLTARFQHALRSSNRRGVIFQPHLLSLYLKTLAILVHAAGPSTLSLPQMTSELWDLLLGVRGQVAAADAGASARGGDLTVTHALLIALAAMFEVNDSSGNGMRRLCVEMSREFVETQEWVAAVFHGTRGGDGGASGEGEENQVKMLAAGVLITLRDAMEKYRALLIGDMIGA